MLDMFRFYPLMPVTAQNATKKAKQTAQDAWGTAKDTARPKGQRLRHGQG